MSNKQNNISLYEYYEKEGFNPIGLPLKTKEQLKLHIKQRDNLYVNYLHLPNSIWRNAKVLEAGCCSGENTLVYALNGATIDIVEPVKTFIDELENLFGHWKIKNSIRKIYNTPIEEFKTKEKYDIVVAEGFLSVLEDRDEVLIKLFNLLKEDGFLIFSAYDVIGSFIEFFKSFIFKYAESLDKDTTTRWFFYDDYSKLNTLKPYENWIRDVILNPTSTIFSSLWSFDGILKTLKSYNPIYYNSYPTYHVPEYVWYKDVKNQSIEKIVNDYKKKSLSFLFEKDMEFNQEIYDTFHKSIKLMDDIKNVDKIRELIIRLPQWVDEDVTALKFEILSCLENPFNYKECDYLRKHWGMHSHFIVLRKGI